jgi:ribonuclease G
MADLPHAEALLIGRHDGTIAAGLIRDGRLDDLMLAPVDGRLATGAVVAARVIRIEPGLDAAFLDIGTPEHALLRARDLPAEGEARALNRRLHEGQLLAVRIVHPGYDDKGPRVIGRVGADVRAEAAGCAPGTVLRAADPLLEIARALGPAEPREIVVADTLARLQAAQAWAAAGRPVPAIAIDPESQPLGRFDALGDIAAALARELPLEGGGRLSFDQTRALLAVDVDSGAGARDIAAGNLAAARAIARQMRIRNSAGVIIIDFIDARPDARGDARGGGRRAAIEGAMREATTADRAGVRHAGFGPLGLYELTRNRLGAPLAELWPTVPEAAR